MDTNVLHVKLISDAKAGINDFIPIIGTFVGGLLTFVGGYFVHRLTVHKEKKKFFREKLEELYVLTCKITDWAGYEYAETICALAKTKPDSPKVTDPFKELVMLARLYHHNLFEDASKVKNLGGELQKHCFSLIVAVANPSNSADNSARLSQITDYMNELQKANDILQKKISEAIKKFI
jgi:hypothetical protein